jgi:hypothetical protein
MRSRRVDVAERAAVERALALALCGFGGELRPAPTSLAQALAVADARFGERVARRIERFAAAPVGAFVWTRDIGDVFWLGRITGDWRYDEAPGAREVDLVHVRPCEWLDLPVEEAEVPPGVLATFARGGLNWQRIHAADAAHLTARLWDYRSAA